MVIVLYLQVGVLTANRGKDAVGKFLLNSCPVRIDLACTMVP